MTAADFTALTNREISFILYSSFPSNPEEYKSIRSISELWHVHRIAVPSIGERYSVPDPILSREIYKDELGIGKPEGEELYLPIFHLHTHPNSHSYPSEPDLINARQRFEMEFGNGRVKVRNPTINVINNNSNRAGFGARAKGDSQFFYQLRENFDKFDQFMKSYGLTLEMALNNNPHFPAEVFAQEMEKSGAFKAVAYSSNSLLELVHNQFATYYPIKKQTQKKLGRKFAYAITAKRIW